MCSFDFLPHAWIHGQKWICSFHLKAEEMAATKIKFNHHSFHLKKCSTGKLFFKLWFPRTQIIRLQHMRHVITCVHPCTHLKHYGRAKKAPLVWLKKFQGVRQIARLKQQLFLSFTFCIITQRSYKKIMCIYLLFDWFGGENCVIFTFSLHKSSVKWSDLVHLKKAQGNSIFSFPYTLFLHIFDT